MVNQSRLTELLEYVSVNSPFYRRMFMEHNIDVKSITGPDQFFALPFTTKDDLAANNADFVCVDKNLIEEYVTTSGTLGDPVYFCLTRKDTDRLAENEFRSMELIGATSNDVFQLMVTMDKLFMAGLAYYLGIKKLGAGIVRTGPGSPLNQLEAILRFKSTVLIAIPSFIVKLIEVAQDRGIDLSKTSVRSIICIGEPIRNSDLSWNELGNSIVSNWPVKLHSTYASTEMSTAFTECEAGAGGHLNPDLLLMEVINEEGQSVKSGELGEVVVTPLGIEGQPLLRYKTGDLCHVYYEPCKCGRTSPRLGPVIGRKQQMIKFKGTTLYPAAIIDVLVKEKIELYQLEVVKDKLGNDNLSIFLPLDYQGSPAMDYLRSTFKSRLRVTPDFQFIEEDILHKRVFSTEKRKPSWIVFV